MSEQIQFKVGDWVALTDNYLKQYSENVQSRMVNAGLPNRFKIKKILTDDREKAVLEGVNEYNVQNKIYTTLGEDALWTATEDLILLKHQSKHPTRSKLNKDFRRIISR